MYRISDRPMAIKEIQKYLSVSRGDFIAPSGSYDENTRQAVEGLQAKADLPQSGQVDLQTFTLLYDEYKRAIMKKRIKENSSHNISFPVLPKAYFEEMGNINRKLRLLLDYYGLTHRLNVGNYYSGESSEAVKALREIYRLEYKDMIDEELYNMMLIDLAFISKQMTIFSKR